jgi:hypothetical protein
MWHLKKHLLEVWQIHAGVGSPSNKPIDENMIVPQDSKDFKKRNLKTDNLE